MKPSEQPLDVPAALVPPELSPVLRLDLSRGAMRDDQLYTKEPELLLKAHAVVRLVTDQSLGQRCYESLPERFEDELRFMALTARNPDGDRKAIAVCHCHDLGRFAAASFSNMSAPLFAPAWEPSM